MAEAQARNKGMISEGEPRFFTHIIATNPASTTKLTFPEHKITSLGNGKMKKLGLGEKKKIVTGCSWLSNQCPYHFHFCSIVLCNVGPQRPETSVNLEWFGKSQNRSLVKGCQN